MRDIKFRGLNGDKTEWIYADLRTAGRLFEQNGVWKDTVGQYTGLQDKNGVDIYEGDILRPNHDRFLWIVSFNDGGFSAIQSNCKNYWCWLKSVFEHNNIEVIGNIHDNSEPLKEG